MAFQEMRTVQPEGGVLLGTTLDALASNFSDAVTKTPTSGALQTIAGALALSGATVGLNALKITCPSGTTASESVWIVDTARAVTGGGSSFRVQSTQTTGALTGTMQAIRCRAQNSVASMTGKIVGVEGYASNNAASANGTVHAGEFWALSKGNNIGTIRGIEVGLDFDGGETVTEATVLRVVSQAAGTITTHVGVSIVDDSASSPGGRVFDAFVKLSKTATQSPGAILDSQGVVGWAAVVAGITLTTGDVPLLAYKDKDGTAHVLVLADNDTVAIRT